MRKRTKTKNIWLIPSSLALLVILAVLAYQLPPIHRRLAWRMDLAITYLRGIVYPVGPVPTPLKPIDQPTVDSTGELPNLSAVTATPTSLPHTPLSPTLSTLPSPTPIPAAVTLPAPAYEQQTMNNCGPASLAMYLRFYGWDGKQVDIASLIKPLDDDRNVNVEELVYYVRNRAGWLKAEFRVGGSLELLKRLMAAGLPVMVEESFYINKPFWPNDDLWAAHYLLLTGYDDASQTFTGQDSFHGADQKVAYATLDNYWHIFNRVYILVYRPEQEDTVKSILGADWDPNLNRQHALATAQVEAQSNPKDAFAWFNVGSNLVYFGRYAEAASTYDTARDLGLPQRMLRYQFGTFFAYFHSSRTEDLLTLTEYALQRTPNAEEALLWHGWALYRKGDTAGAVADFRKALKANPNGQDAKNALNFVGASP